MKKRRVWRVMMPNIWTHIMFANDVAQQIGLEIKEEQQAFFELGAQGPDPYFYHHFWPWKKNKPVEEMGGNVHYHHCGPYLMDMIRTGSEKADLKLRIYILGFVTHHLLDRNAHPYIIYRSGNEGHKHQRLEVIIDTILMKKHYDIKTWKTAVYKRFDVGDHLYPPIETMLSQLNQTYFSETTKNMPVNYIDDAYRDMKQAQKLLFDPLGWKNKLLGDMVSPFSYKKVAPDKDILNIDHTTWYHPVDNTERHNESFYDLLDQAKAEAQIILPLILNYWETQVESEWLNIKEEIKNQSYDTGKDCTLPITNQHFDPII